MSVLPTSTCAHRIAPSVDSDSARLRPMDWDEAQDWCNFVLLRPDELPPGTRCATGTIRPEAPPGRPPGLDLSGRFEHGISNRASYRFEVHGRDRALRVKQFCYDLGPPAFGFPSMWLNPTRPFVRDGVVGWVGQDFHGRPAACVELDQTMVEIAVLRGSFSDDELSRLAVGLRPVSDAGRAAVLATGLTERFYQRRHPDVIITVPMGYWTHRRGPAGTTALRADEVPGWLSLWEVPPPPSDFVLDSMVYFGAPDRPRETDWVYRDRFSRHGGLRVLTWDLHGEKAPYPPRLDRQPCQSQVVELAGRPVHHAYGDPGVGQHEAVTRRGGRVVMVLAKATPDTDGAWFHSVLEAMLGE